ncbi:MAG: XRE family transcriptional regulator [Spirochaetae bacterium HGW-Spirochaetae-1]|jgi:DNA-binding XRE family transcriptional regulator|nr:MAG: XRE family transcriptional regulator [Spirochaetae bacterium HGW-Spirochaetae-1]
MQVHVKTPRINIEMKGEIPEEIVRVIRKVYGKKAVISEDDTLVNIRDTEWFKDIDARLTPGKAMANYRKLLKLTQAELGEKLGGIPKQNISQMECDVRPISKKVAKQLAALYKVSVEEFI